ncbi:hypothetical protein [Okeania sp. SIO1I7]|nr:hypothetical protein [Okeania sp. SIO1I7]
MNVRNWAIKTLLMRYVIAIPILVRYKILCFRQQATGNRQQATRQ